MATAIAKESPARVPNRIGSAPAFIRLKALRDIALEPGSAPPRYVIDVVRGAAKAREVVIDLAGQIGKIEGNERLSEAGRMEDRATAITEARKAIETIEAETAKLAGLHDGAKRTHEAALSGVILKMDAVEAVRATEIRSLLRSMSAEARRSAIFNAISDGDRETLRALATDPAPATARLVLTEAMRSSVASKLIEIAAPAESKETAGELAEIGDLVARAIEAISVARAAFEFISRSRA